MPSDSRISWIEVAVVLVIVAVLARFYWADELMRWQEATFGPYIYLLTLPLFGFAAYGAFRDQAPLVKRRVIRLIVSGLLLIFVAVGTMYFLGV